MLCPFGYEVGDPATLGACVLPSTLARCQCVEVIGAWVTDPAPGHESQVLRWWRDQGEL